MDIAGKSEAEYRWPRSRIGTLAILSGIFVALASQVVLSLLGGAIGLSLRDTGASELGAGTVIWYWLSLAVSAFAGGFTAASVARDPLRRDGLLHGVVVWAGFTVASVTLLRGLASQAFSGAMGATGVDIGEAAAAGFWTLAIGHLMPLLTALLGGFLGSRSEAKILGRREEATRRETIAPASPTQTPTPSPV